MPNGNKNPKVSTKIGQIQNKPSKNHQIFQEFDQSGKISPSLVTLNASQMFPLQMKQKNAAAYFQNLSLKCH